ncbi:hypothetical protein, partial [Candidatus Protofrankia datiscae]
MNAVDLDWALISKVPGQRDDYGLLRSSATGRLRPGAMARMVSHFSPGSPSSPGGEHRERADALPWVTFTFATVASSRYVGVAIREWPWESTAPVDATGRPIVPTRFFCLPLEDFERYFGSCLALYQAVAKLAVPERNDDPLSVLVQSHDEEASRARERLLGDSRMFTAAAAVAAAVLDGPVALTPGYQSPRYPLADRIAFIDAVAALLPAGVRATLSAGTWVDNRTSHKIRLAFTHRLRDGLGEIDPDDPPGADTVTDRHGDGIGRGGDPTRDSGHSHIYAENLKKLCHHWGSDAVLRWLAADHKPYSFKQPGEIVDALVTAERNILVDRAREKNPASSPATGPEISRAGLVVPSEEESAPLRYLIDGIRGHLRSVRPSGYLAAELLSAFLWEIGESGDAGSIADDVKLVERHWVAEALPALRALCRRLAAVDADSRLLTALMAMAGRLDCVPEILVDFLNMRGGVEEADSRIRRVVIDFVIEQRGDTAGWQEVRNLLAADHTYTIHTLYRQVESDESTEGQGGRDLLRLVGWLEAADQPVSRDVLNVFRALEVASSFPQAVSAADVGRLSGPDGADDLGVRALLARAARTGRLDEVRPVFESWFEAASPRFDQPRREAWTDFLDQLKISGGLRRRLLKAASGESRSWWFLRRGGGRAVADGPPADVPVDIAANWMNYDFPGKHDDPAVARLVAHYSPGAPTEVSFFGDGVKNVAVLFRGPVTPAGRENSLWCCYAAYEEFSGIRPRMEKFYYAAEERVHTSNAPRAGLRMPSPMAAVDDVVAAIDAFGFGAVAATAALVLDGPVTIAMPKPPVPRRLRLAFLDAVLALLPAGAYASLTACTWMSGNGVRRFRIAFSDNTKISERHVVFWQGLPAVPSLRSGFARTYYRRN